MTAVFIGSNINGLDMDSTAGGDGLVEGATTNSVDVEVNIADITKQTRLQTIMILKQIIRYIEDGRTATLPL